MGCVDYSEEAMIQNLKDVGCKDDVIEQFLELQKLCKLGEQVCLLSKVRKELLQKLHLDQEQLDCLDYLLYKIKAIQCKKKSEESD